MIEKKSELVCKPDSVNDDHLSRYYVAIIFMQPTQILSEQLKWISIWSCFGLGFTMPYLSPTKR